MKRILMAVAALVVALAAALAWKIRAERSARQGPARAWGTVEATAITMSSQLAAEVRRVPVREGQQVDAGTLLVELDCADAKALVPPLCARYRDGG